MSHQQMVVFVVGLGEHVGLGGLVGSETADSDGSAEIGHANMPACKHEHTL